MSPMPMDQAVLRTESGPGATGMTQSTPSGESRGPPRQAPPGSRGAGGTYTLAGCVFLMALALPWAFWNLAGLRTAVPLLFAVALTSAGLGAGIWIVLRRAMPSLGPWRALAATYGILWILSIPHNFLEGWSLGLLPFLPFIAPWNLLTGLSCQAGLGCPD